MAQNKDDLFNSSEKDTTATGSDVPGGDGTVSDEAMDAIGVGVDAIQPGSKTGQDHSLENYEDSEPTSGVGAFQRSSNTLSDIYHKGEDEEKE